MHTIFSICIVVQSFKIAVWIISVTFLVAMRLQNLCKCPVHPLWNGPYTYILINIMRVRRIMVSLSISSSYFLLLCLIALHNTSPRPNILIYTTITSHTQPTPTTHKFISRINMLNIYIYIYIYAYIKEYLITRQALSIVWGVVIT